MYRTFKYGIFNVSVGDLVTIRTPQGQTVSGRPNALLMFPTHCVLNLGGRYGTPGVANADNIVAVSPKRQPQ